MEDIYTVLKNLGINYTEHKHTAVFTSEEASKYELDPEAARCKNLFLRNQKKTRFYLVIIESSKKADLGKLTKLLEEEKLSFASPDDLIAQLRLTPGSVSPFALINNQEHNAVVIIDSALMKYQKLSFHPNVNTSTLVLATKDFEKFLGSVGNKYKEMDL